MTWNLFHLASQNINKTDFGVAALLDTQTHTNISIHAAESCCTQHHAVKLMGAAAHIDRLPDWQMHKDALQSRLSPLLFCALPFTSCHVKQCAAFRKLFFLLYNSLACLANWLSSLTRFILTRRCRWRRQKKREGLCLKTGEGLRWINIYYLKNLSLWCSVDQCAGKRVHR